MTSKSENICCADIIPVGSFIVLLFIREFLALNKINANKLF